MHTRKRSMIRVAIEFLKLQIAGNIIFWGTYLGYFVSDYFFGHPELLALAISSLLAHILFFIVSRDWVFDTETGKRKQQPEIMKFIIFMGFNYILNLVIIEALRVLFGITPYIGQFISGLFFGVWNYLGLKFWVFAGNSYYLPFMYQPRKERNHGE